MPSMLIKKWKLVLKYIPVKIIQNVQQPQNGTFWVWTCSELPGNLEIQVIYIGTKGWNDLKVLNFASATPLHLFLQKLVGFYLGIYLDSHGKLT